MEYILYTAFTWWFVKFEPLQMTFDYIIKLLPINRLTNLLYESVGCPKCVGFWLTLICTGSFFTACVVSLCSFTLDICLAKLEY